MSEEKKSKKGKKGKSAPLTATLENAEYTDVITGVPGSTIVIYGHKTRAEAYAIAHRQLETSAARAHAALEALEANNFAVRYRKHMDVVSGSGDRTQAG